MRIARVLDASDPRHRRHDVRAGRDYAIRNPEDALLVRVNDDEGPLTSVDRSRLRAMGYTPWDEKPGYDGQSYMDRHGFADDQETWNQEVTERLNRQHENRPVRITRDEPMREAQQSLIERLLRELEGINTDTHALASSWYADEKAAGRMTKARASEVITRLKRHCGYEEGTWKKRADFVAPAPEKGPEHEGLYKLSRTVTVRSGQVQAGTLVQVMRGKDSNKLYAKTVEFNGQTTKSGKVKPTLTHISGLIFKILDSELVSAEEAQALTQKTGWCVFGHFLTNPTSIARGMGPKCYERYPHLARNAA